MWGGGGVYKMVTQAISPPPQWQSESGEPLVCRDQTRVFSAEGSQVTCANPLYLRQFLNEWFMHETFFFK